MNQEAINMLSFIVATFGICFLIYFLVTTIIGSFYAVKAIIRYLNDPLYREHYIQEHNGQRMLLWY